MLEAVVNTLCFALAFIGLKRLTSQTTGFNTMLQPYLVLAIQSTQLRVNTSSQLWITFIGCFPWLAGFGMDSFGGFGAAGC